MRPELLVVKDFRNLRQARLDIAPWLTFLVGDNAQGKTNALEALSYALSLKPLRAARLAELVHHDAEQACIDVKLKGPTLPWDIHIEQERTARRVWVNGKILSDTARLVGAVALVTFAPDDLALVKGMPEVRRRSLDRFVFQTRPAHLGCVNDYRRALQSRNALLRQGIRERGILDAFTYTLAEAALRVMLGRQHGIEALRQTLEHRHGQLAPDGGVLSLHYRPSIALNVDANEKVLVETIVQAFERSIAVDMERRQTTKGPHLDDLQFALDAQMLRKFGSQGQMRSAVLALRLAEVDELARVRGEGPLLLADDLLAELDVHRCHALLQTLADTRTMVVATGTRVPEGVDSSSAGVAVVEVCAGQLGQRRTALG